MSIIVKGTYWDHASGHVSENWGLVCKHHEEEFPQIHECYRGTFNVRITDQPPYVPPGEADYRRLAKERGGHPHLYGDGNHVSPRAKVLEINGTRVEAWIYRGGHTDKPVLELLSRENLSKKLSVGNGDTVTLLIVEVEEGSQGMPAPPPPRKGPS